MPHSKIDGLMFDKGDITSFVVYIITQKNEFVKRKKRKIKKFFLFLKIIKIIAKTTSFTGGYSEWSGLQLDLFYSNSKAIAMLFGFFYLCRTEGVFNLKIILNIRNIKNRKEE
jgi:hypothetical protein